LFYTVVSDNAGFLSFWGGGFKALDMQALFFQPDYNLTPSTRMSYQAVPVSAVYLSRLHVSDD
jgi:hypothetical protein